MDIGGAEEERVEVRVGAERQVRGGGGGPCRGIPEVEAVAVVAVVLPLPYAPGQASLATTAQEHHGTSL